MSGCRAPCPSDGALAMILVLQIQHITLLKYCLLANSNPNSQVAPNDPKVLGAGRRFSHKPPCYEESQYLSEQNVERKKSSDGSERQERQGAEPAQWKYGAVRGAGWHYEETSIAKKGYKTHDEAGTRWRAEKALRNRRYGSYDNSKSGEEI